ncbi:MAG: energy transducer TonB [Desulfomonilaceae bacterium]
MHEPQLSNNIAEIEYDSYSDCEESFDDPFADTSGETPEPESVLADGKDTILKYCIIASCVLHIALFTGLPHMSNWAQTKSLLRPGEKVTPVRLVESPPESKKPEPPPQKASAISDRNHTALRQRLPKMLPAPKPPIGKMEPLQKKLAALPPPAVPEDLVKPKEEKRLKEDNPKPLAPDKHTYKNRLKRTDPLDHRPLSRSPKRVNVDLRPTPADIRRGLSPPGGSPEFFPEGDANEAVVDINTRDDRFFSYLIQLKRKIQAVWTYPSAAAHAGIGGSLTLEFSIARTGQLLGVNLLDSSGHTVLDESAMKAIKNAAPYYPFPPRLHAKRLRIRANFIYVTGNSFRSIM